MEYGGSGDAAGRRRGWALLALAAATVLAVVFAVPSLDPSETGPESQGPQRPTVRAANDADRNGDRPRRDERGDRSGPATAFDDGSPAIANLDPELRAAFRRAAQAAQQDGVVLHVTSGWRSAAHQQELLDRAVTEYGSGAEALKWVSTPETSAHVTGDAVDIGHDAAIAWLSRHGASYDLCQIYRNEPWHYELRTGAADHGCPARYADPTHDPRMQR